MGFRRNSATGITGNTFSEQAILNLLKDFTIVKEDHELYGATYLLQLSEKPAEIVKEDYKEVITRLTNQKKAIDLVSQKQHEEALTVWSDYPDAHIISCNTLPKNKS